MKWVTTILFFFVVVVWAEKKCKEVLPLAERCDEELCKLPHCRCSSARTPGDLAPEDTPQLITFSFDDAINARNSITYQELLFGRKNSNGCPIGCTFYVNHEYTDYFAVHNIFNQGYEIALHSITHQTPPTYWQNACYEDMEKEFGYQRGQMSHFAGIPANALKGTRMPFLQMTGNSTAQVMADYGLLYDCSWPTHDHNLWPYTLDYASTQECFVPPCPTASIPGVWIKPMISWRDLDGFPCAMVDSCYSVPSPTSRTAREEWLALILANFNRHYKGSRTPFDFSLHEWYLTVHPGLKAAIADFIELIVETTDDVFFVNTVDVIEFVQLPVKLSDYKKRPCKTPPPTFCRRTSCGPLRAKHNQKLSQSCRFFQDAIERMVEMDYWMQTCNTCPRVYPWLDNPIGI